MKYIYPINVVLTGGETENVSVLTEKRDLQIGLEERRVARLKGGSFIILDFGREISGSARILTFAANGDREARIRFGESMAECCAEIGGSRNATNDHSNRDFTMKLQNYSDMTFGNTGFRFLRLDVSAQSELYLKSALAVSDADERTARGEFICDDPTVNEIWNTAAYTLRLCLHNGFFWDGVKRDRLVWIGDLYPEMRSAFAVFGNVEETENSLRFVRKQTPLPRWMNKIPMYSFWWLIILAEYAAYGGRAEYVREELPYVKGLVALFADNVAADGSTQFDYNFIDWPTHYEAGDDPDKRSDELAGVHYLLTIALQKTAELLGSFGEDASECYRLLSVLSRKSFCVKKYKQVAALGVLAGEKSEAYRRLLLKGGVAGMSTFMSYSILSALGEYGEYSAALSMLKEYYGGMLSRGATTFWEDFDIAWLKGSSRIDRLPLDGEKDIHGDFGAFCYKGYRHSLCHGWASGVAAYLSETVLGVRPLRTDGKKLTIRPRLGGLKWAKGSYPTPLGEVRVEHRLNEDGRVESRAAAPEGIEISFE